MADVPMSHPETGATLRRGLRPTTFTFAGESMTVDQPGWWPEGDGDGVLTSADMEATEFVLVELKRRAAARAPADDTSAPAAE